jgi:hypothetical protein
LITLQPKPGVARKFLVYDLEWRPGTLEVTLCGVFDGERYRYYETPRSFIGGELTPKNSGKWFYAHFGGGADFQFILAELVKFGTIFSVRGSFSGSSAIIVEVRRANYVWTFVDSYWLLRDSLASIGKWIGLEKGPGIELTREWYLNASLAELIPYNERDCLILYKAIVEFQRILLEIGGELKKTIAGSALNLFRSRYLKKEVHTNASVNRKARLSYCASRVEVFEKKCEKALYYDVNSSFPYAMTFPLPGNLIKSSLMLDDRLLYEPDQTPFLALARIRVQESYLPPLPYRENGRVFFPTGEWESWFTGIDLSLLLETGGTIVSISEVMEFEPFYDIADYAMDIYDRRKNSEGFIRLAYKYLLNSLYGKFGEAPENKQTLWLNPPENVLEKLSRSEAEDGTPNRSNMAMPGLWIETVDRYVPHEHVPLASQITSIARRTLYNFLKDSETVYYCDTDGFATTTTYPESAELGGLKLEKRIESGRFIAPKLYDLFTDKVDLKTGKKEHIIKGKGFSLKGDEDKYENVIHSKMIEVDRMRRIRENLAHGHCTPTEDTITKTFRDTLTPKRKFDRHGKSRPWSVGEISKTVK